MRRIGIKGHLGGWGAGRRPRGAGDFPRPAPCAPCPSSSLRLFSVPLWFVFFHRLE
ncbi:hypothetical protein RAS1_10380 [Phycisphaerae bacterium RAS1]|nr:hypothetical protein RAS1_10380 [Phycisphaerae bacterium RAS1]